MTDFSSLPPHVEFSLLRFQLEFQEPYRLNLEVLLRLRRDLRTTASHVLGERGGRRFSALFDPPLPVDPVALRRFQRPGPPFVFLPDPEQQGDYDAGDRFVLCVAFWGQGIQLLGDFARVLQSLGKLGLHRGEGLFELAAIEAEDAAGNRFPVWQEGSGMPDFAPPVNDLRWWLNRFSETSSTVLEFLTPARLLSQGRPLFQVDFRRLFPFILRRVGSMLHAHCGAEVIDDPGSLLAAVAQVRETENRLGWQDWRTLAGPEQAQELGGVAGSIRLEGEGLPAVLWILRVGTLMNVGKGASFGSGRFRLNEPASR